MNAISLYKRIFTLCILLVSTPIVAETLNVFHDNPNAVIFVDGTPYYDNELRDYEVDPGSHQIKVKIDDDIVYSRIVVVPKDQTTTIDTNPMVGVSDSKVPDAGPSKQEAKRLRNLRGDFAIGGQLGSVSGLSLKKYWGRNGVQLAGWYSSSAEIKGVNVRYLRNLMEKLVGVDQPVTLYSGVGYGYVSNANGFDFDSKQDHIYELLIGVERQRYMGYYSLSVVFRHINRFVTGGSHGAGENVSKSGFLLSGGYHFYF